LAKERIRGLQKIWTALTKFIASQCGNGRTVDLPLAGKFKKLKVPEGSQDKDSAATEKYAFMPHLDFVGSGHFKFPENESNVSPFAKNASSFATNVVTVSLTSIGAVCNLDRESLAAALKAIFVEFLKVARAGSFCKLDMRIGSIVAYPNGSLQFENNSDLGSLHDAEIAVDLSDSRFIARKSATGATRTMLGSQAGQDLKSKSMTRFGKSNAAAGGGDKKSQSLYSSVQVGRTGFSKLSQQTSVMTPFSNIGGEVSRYGGKNRMLKQWYEGKCF